MKITTEAVKHVEKLCRLRLTDEEQKKFTEQLTKILTYMDKLNELNTENVEPTSHVADLKNILRKDTIIKSMDIENVLSNAPDKDSNCFKVPAIIE